MLEGVRITMRLEEVAATGAGVGEVAETRVGIGGEE